MGKGTSSDDDRMLASLVKMDKTLGRLFDRLDQMGEMDNTLVIVTSDNGPSSSQRYYTGGHVAPGSTENLRGRKWSPYEGGILQPLILYWPGPSTAGYPDPRSVGQWSDLLPPYLHLSRLPTPLGFHSFSLS